MPKDGKVFRDFLPYVSTSYMPQLTCPYCGTDFVIQKSKYGNLNIEVTYCDNPECRKIYITDEWED